MERTQNLDDGIDFFDFLYELWRAKWLFISIVVVAVLLGAASLIPRMMAGEPVAPPRDKAKVQFRLDLRADPYLRSGNAIIADYLTRLTSKRELMLSSEEAASLGIPLTRNTYRIGFSPGANIGVMTVSAAGAPEGYFAELHSAMEDVAREQLEDTKRSLAADLAAIQSIRQNVYDGDSETLSRRVFDATRFLSDPDVQDGTRRFIWLEPPEVFGDATVVASGVTARLLIAGMAGCIIAVLAVMFRIGIERGRARRIADV